MGGFRRRGLNHRSFWGDGLATLSRMQMRSGGRGKGSPYASRLQERNSPLAGVRVLACQNSFNVLGSFEKVFCLLSDISQRFDESVRIRLVEKFIRGIRFL